MKPLRITNIQRGCVQDGPGVRTTVFLKGCSLRCPWCCNPEAISFEEQFYLNDEKCLLHKGVISRICDICERNGGVHSVTDCPFGVAEAVSNDYSIDSLIEVLIKDVALYRETKGGVTFSGGEPVLYAQELEPILMELKNNDINIAFETSLVVPVINISLLRPLVDYWIVDLKLQPQMKLFSEEYLGLLSDNLCYISRSNKWFRMVFVDDIYSERETVINRLHQLSVGKLELLCCHNIAQNKYLRLNLKNDTYSADYKKACQFADYLRHGDIDVSVVSV